MSIITIGREFGSGGREVGKRLADALGYAYYDKEIVEFIAERHEMDENYVDVALSGGFMSNFPLHFGRTFSYASTAMMVQNTKLFAEQHKVLREIAAEGNCIIVGKAADVILKDFKPFRVFVYADMSSRIARCRTREDEGSHLSDKGMERRIKRIDAERARYHEIFSGTPWGNKAGYDLCINTTGQEIKKLVPHVAAYIRSCLEIEE